VLVHRRKRQQTGKRRCPFSFGHLKHLT
jgi:hypothetical protein